MNLSDRIQALSPQQRALLRQRLDRMAQERNASRPGEQSLAGYVICRNGQTIAANDLREFLRNRLPEYMVPSTFHFLDAFPLTPNGKVDRQKLLKPVVSIVAKVNGAGTEGLRPRPMTPVEETLAKIWCEVLGVANVSINDNFFDIGGHSVLALRVLGRLRKIFQVDVSVRTVFDSPTLEKLAAAVTKARQNGALAPIRKVPRLNGSLPDRDSLPEANGVSLNSARPGEATIRK
jgi:acyl carrier protein